MSKLYWLEKSNVEAVSASIEAILNKIPNQKFDYVIGEVEHSQNRPIFHSLADLCLFWARKNKKLKNDRTLFINEEQSFELISILLKDKFGPDFPLSQILDVYSNPEDPIYEKYEENLKNSNLIDAQKLKKILEGETFEFDILLILDESKEFLDLFTNYEQFKIQLEQSLDASMHENANPEFNLTIEELKMEETNLKNERKSGEGMSSQLKKVEAAMKLLVNSKDELSLAKMVCTGPNPLLTHQAFTTLKKNSSLPLFQTIMSHAQKLTLGGKSYCPTESHPFAPFHQELLQISELMDKLYNQLDEEPKLALKKICNILRKYLEVDSLDFYKNIFAQCQLRQNGPEWSSIGMLRQILDFCATKPTGKINLHQLMGKIGQHSSPKVLDFFTSPNEVVKKPVVPEKEVSTPKVTKNKTNSDGKPRFQSTMAWAAETSPLILKSDEKVPVRTYGVTAVMQIDASPILSKATKTAKMEAEQILKEAKEVNKEIKLKKPLPKRSILSDIKNAEKWTKPPSKKPKLDDIQGEENAKVKVAKKPKLNDIKGQENEKVKVVKKVSKSKQKPLLKGQMKMTSFLRM